MPARTLPRLGLAAALALALLGGCDGAGAPDGGGLVPNASQPAPPSYLREFVFMGTRGDEAVMVPFSFAATPAPDGVARVTRAWLGRDGRWSAFVDDRWLSSTSSDVWLVMPHGDVRLAARGTIDIEAIWYRRGGRSLRLDLGPAVSAWSDGEDARFRVHRGRLRLGAETVQGAVLETLRVARPGTDGSPSRGTDWLFLASGDSLRLVVARIAGRDGRPASTFAWTGRAEGERAWEAAEVDWIEVRPVEEARRDLPMRWSFRIAEAGVAGEVTAVGYDLSVSEEERPRRALQAWFTVDGWIEIEGRRAGLTGAVGHAQN